MTMKSHDEGDKTKRMTHQQKLEAKRTERAMRRSGEIGKTISLQDTEESFENPWLPYDPIFFVELFERVCTSLQAARRLIRMSKSEVGGQIAPEIVRQIDTAVTEAIANLDRVFQHQNVPLLESVNNDGEKVVEKRPFLFKETDDYETAAILQTIELVDDLHINRHSDELTPISLQEDQNRAKTVVLGTIHDYEMRISDYIEEVHQVLLSDQNRNVLIDKIEQIKTHFEASIPEIGPTKGEGQFVRQRRRKTVMIDSPKESMALLPEMHNAERHINKTKTADQIDALIEHVFFHEKESLSLEDLSLLEGFVQERRIAIKAGQKRLEAFQEVEKIARQIFPELSKDEPVTGERLTELFTAHSELPRSKFKSDAKKQRYCDLVKAFREAGGSVTRDGEEVKMNLFTPYKATEKAFRTVLLGSGNKRANSHWTPPALVLSVVPSPY